MDPEFNGVIQRKLALLERQLTNLEHHLRDIDETQFKDDWVLRSMAERALQVAAEIIIDVAERVIAIKGAGPVASASEALERLVTLNVLVSPEPYVSIVRFRNLIVHRYEEIEPGLLFDLAKTRLGDFRRFREEIDAAASKGTD